MGDVCVKARVPNSFFLFSSRYTLESMIAQICHLSFELFNKGDGFVARRKLDLIHNVFISQTWLLDMLYDIIALGHYGYMNLSEQDCLKLIAYYNNYQNSISCKSNKSRYDVLYQLFAFFGEQKRFQESHFFDDFSREKYILEEIPKKNNLKFDFNQEFEIETGMTPDRFSSIIFILFTYFTTKSCYFDTSIFESWSQNLNIPIQDIIMVLGRYSSTPDEIRKDKLKRQKFYTSPIIKINNSYIATNPYLLLALFTNSNYWVLRNKYLNQNSRAFANLFGQLFELYVEELLQNCVDKEHFRKIEPVSKQKRADWLIKLDDYNIIVEQKSSLPTLSIQQNTTDPEEVKKHMKKCWGEAVEQLKATEDALNLKNSIKIVLMYDEYFKEEAIEWLFPLRPDLYNDRKYWLVSIRSFEILLMTYKKHHDVFVNIMKEKIEAEACMSKAGRELPLFYDKYHVNNNSYLKEYGISTEFDDIINHILKEMTK